MIALKREKAITYLRIGKEVGVPVGSESSMREEPNNTGRPAAHWQG